MTIMTRREFLSNLFFPVGSLVVMGPAVYASDQIDIQKLVNGNGPFLDECSIVYRAWIIQEEITPLGYLSGVFEKHQLDSGEISDVVKLDFLHQNIFLVEGLHLSKTEAAFLALIGSGVNS